MPRVVAQRGVCIAPGRHLAAGEHAELPQDSTLQFLLSINAVKVIEEAPPPEPEASDAEDSAPSDGAAADQPTPSTRRRAR